MKRNLYLCSIMKKKRTDILVLFIHVAIMVLIIILPPMGTYLSTTNITEAGRSLGETLNEFVPIFAIYLINYYWLIPRVYYQSKVKFFIVNLFIIIAILASYFWRESFSPDDFYVPWVYFIVLVDFVMLVLSVTCALAIRTIIRLHDVEMQLREVKQQNAEAELVWLKNQLNPHFLFNTLNNISSLVYIDADHAQDSITKLSDLLRYALYESSKAEVSLSDEVEFMQNYISLMKLRCSDKVKVETNFDLSQPGVKIAPMLFISVLENAFKHGVSTHQPSFIHASLCVKDDNIVFTCDNSNFPKKDKNLTAGGVGIENTQRRLELLYPQRSKYVHTLQDDIYHVEIKIKL